MDISIGITYPLYMAVGVTSVGPLEPEVRDQLADYRDREGYPNYNAALRSLLDMENNDATHE